MLSPRRTRPAPCEIVIGDPILLLVLFFVEELKQRNCLTHGSRGRHKSRIISKIDQFLKNRRSNDYKKKKKNFVCFMGGRFSYNVIPVSS